jgi:hypothetical protein
MFSKFQCIVYILACGFNIFDNLFELFQKENKQFLVGGTITTNEWRLFESKWES